MRKRREIPHECLRASDVPAAGATWEEIIDFAWTFNAWKHFPDAESCFKLVRSDGPDTLEKLRTELWVNYRGMCHIGDPPDEGDRKVIESILERICSQLTSQ
jgi:hypothetical protein